MIQHVENVTHHISRQFNMELEAVKTRMLEMGGKVEKQLRDALDAIIRLDSDLARRVNDYDEEIDSLEMSIDAECSRILARRQPAASDLRLLLSIIKAIRDLERIGDESCKIAKMAVRLCDAGDSSRGLDELQRIGERVSKMVHVTLDAFARFDVDSAITVNDEDDDVDELYGAAIREMIKWMRNDPASIERVLNIIWALRALERIGDHAKNLSEHIMYLVEGTDIRHGGLG